MANSIDYYRKRAGFTVEALAKELGISREYLQDLKSEKKPGGLTLQLLRKMAGILNCSVAELISDAITIKITGLIKTGGKVELVDTEEAELVQIPPMVAGSPIREALRFSDDSNSPWAFKGDTIFLGERIPRGLEDFTNARYAVQIKDGDLLAFCRLRPSRTQGRFSLIMPNGNLVEDIEIEWCARVLASSFE